MSEPLAHRRHARSQRSGALVGLATAVVLAASSGIAATPADAYSARQPDPDSAKSEVDRDIASARAELGDLTAEAAAAVVALRRTQASLATTRAKLAEQNAIVAESAARLAQTQRQLADARQREAAGLRELAANAAATEFTQDRRDNLARVAYEGGAGSQMAVLLDVDSAGDLAERAQLVDTVSAYQGAVIDALQAARARAQVVQQELRNARREIAQLTVQNQAELDRSRVARAEVATQTTALAALATRQTSQQRALATEKAKEQGRLNSLERESDRLTAVLQARAEKAARARQAQRAARAKQAQRAAAMTRTSAVKRQATARAGSAPQPRRPAAGSGPLSAPVNAPITSSFGMRFHPILNYARLHAGTDFGAACGAPVYAAGSGQIVRAGNAGGYGNQIVIGHAGSLATTYNHLSAILVSSGPVRRGQLIGRVGTTGLSTGCHLHFEVRNAGVPVNPSKYL